MFITLRPYCTKDGREVGNESEVCPRMVSWASCGAGRDLFDRRERMMSKLGTCVWDD